MAKTQHALGPVSQNSRRRRKTAELRQHAEQHLQSQPPASGDQASIEQTRRLVYELQVHEIELEMQNEELRVARAAVEQGLERYTDLYDFAPVGYFTLALDGSIRALNLPAARLLKLERSRLVGHNFRRYVAAGARAAFDSWLAGIFATQGEHSCAVLLIKEGSEPISVELEATLSPDGQEARVVAVDVTLRKGLEEQLRQAQKMELIGQLAGGVAHDFNNILAAVLLNLGLLQALPPLPREALAPLRDIEALAKRATSLTTQLLLFSRRKTIQTGEVEVNATLTRVLEMVARLLGEDIGYVRLGEASELWIEADVAMIEQALMNLCMNARDAMPRGGTLTFETSLVEFDAQSTCSHPQSRPGDFACLRISDTGCGMSAEILAHLFEPFFTTKELGKGTGLGLSTAYGAVHQHRGWLEVESAPGQGTSFRIYFPMLRKAEPAPLIVVQPIHSQATGQTILLVEDEPELLHVASRALTRFGYCVLSARDGKQALELWGQHQDVIDLMLTDMRMPRGISGLQLAERFWNSKPELKVVIMSGYNQDLGYGANAANARYTFLPKPFDLDCLAGTIERCLAQESRLVS